MTKKVKQREQEVDGGSKETSVVVRDTPAPAPVEPAAESLISQAISQNVPVETMEKLLAMRKELRAEKSKELYYRAMAEFQGECPVIKKNRAGGKTQSGDVAYYYAPLDSIVIQTKDLIKKHGFSYAINTTLIKDNTGQTTGVKTACIVKHLAGHSETSEVEVPLGTKTNVMSASQVVASAITFSKRYAFCNAFGILTGDDDDDSNTTKTKTVDDKIAVILQKIKEDTSVDRMHEFNEKVQKSKVYTPEQKKVIDEAIKDRLAEIVPPATKTEETK